jgi:hypothetical protein
MMKKIIFLPLLLSSMLCWSQYTYIARWKGNANIDDEGNLNKGNYEKCWIQTYVKEIYAFTTIGTIEVGDEKYSLIEKTRDEDHVQQYKATGKFGKEFVIFFAKYMTKEGNGIDHYEIYILDATTLKGSYYDCW